MITTAIHVQDGNSHYAPGADVGAGAFRPHALGGSLRVRKAYMTPAHACFIRAGIANALANWQAE
jgi:hypothetical protein